MLACANIERMNHQATEIIEALGGTAEVSRIFSLSMPSVSDWKKTGIPKARMMFLEVAHAEALRGIDIGAATSDVDRATDKATA